MPNRKKSGQTEDILADLIPGLILIIVTMFLVGFATIGSENKVELKSEQDMRDLYSFDRLTFLRSPVNVSGCDKDVSMAELLVKLSDYSKSGIGEEWINTSLISGGVCGSRLRKMIEDRIGSYAFEWDIKVSDKIKVLFTCKKESYLDEATKISPFLVPVPGSGIAVKVIVKYGVSVLTSYRLTDYTTLTNYTLPSKEGENLKINMKVKFFGFE